ncbi:hypothetical protein NS319_11405 [Sphingomonas sanguinis]|uniref:Uncharacterized protein n=1 Tax=Sphingomonas sanguinis TaxID=33051 RepID=A0A147HW73_9SPHN|nr:hypothetical protein NS319_11405 [Sphingomonas sanguinis]
MGATDASTVLQGGSYQDRHADTGKSHLSLSMADINRPTKRLYALRNDHAGIVGIMIKPE